MPKVIPPEVRRRAVAAYDSGGGTLLEIATLFGVGTASLGRWRRQKAETGTVEPGKVGGFVPPLISEDDLAVVKRLVGANNDAFIHELVELYADETGVRVSRAVMSRALARAGLTRKKDVPRHRARV